MIENIADRIYNIADKGVKTAYEVHFCGRSWQKTKFIGKKY